MNGVLGLYSTLPIKSPSEFTHSAVYLSEHDEVSLEELIDPLLTLRWQRGVVAF